MPSSPINLSLTLMCLAVAVGVISCSRSHMVLNPALENSRGAPVGEEIPEGLTIPELQWVLSNAELPPVQVDDAPRTRMELVRRDSVTAKPVNCMNYFWKSRTAC
ncbi:somatostatin 2 [Electrophorus electricus]|uniref:Somatostatin/Cortistatin C-terminal domain-containing protein n=2 Tax=Electrophorus TaxID=8004 RepID=A0A4W4FGG5_ELEEL|nr:somatostatin 2 [Electrophorus electricus]